MANIDSSLMNRFGQTKRKQLVGSSTTLYMLPCPRPNSRHVFHKYHFLQPMVVVVVVVEEEE
jgi:hypothetical protein